LVFFDNKVLGLFNIAYFVIGQFSAIRGYLRYLSRLRNFCALIQNRRCGIYVAYLNEGTPNIVGLFCCLFILVRHNDCPLIMPDDYFQPEDGYRFSQDSIDLARFAPFDMPGQAADLGAGCGVVGLEALTMGRLKGLERLFFVEAQQLFSQSLKENLKRHKSLYPHGPELCEIWADWRTIGLQAFNGPLDLILANPPYFPPGASGPLTWARNLARHQILGDLEALFKAAFLLLRLHGRLMLCWPRKQLPKLIKDAHKASLVPLRFSVPSRPSSALVLCELEKFNN
jgi:tRNA1Val (adenine37-N6)-methyltransferase